MKASDQISGSTVKSCHTRSLKRRDDQPALVVGKFDYHATPFQHVLRQGFVSVSEAASEAPLKNGLDNGILDKGWGIRIAI